MPIDFPYSQCGRKSRVGDHLAGKTGRCPQCQAVIQILAVPPSEDALYRAIGEAHRRYTRQVNFREGWRGHLWQERFGSFVMDEPYLLASARYVERNPVKATLVSRAEDWPWSSAAAHVDGRRKDALRRGRGFASGWPDGFARGASTWPTATMRNWLSRLVNTRIRAGRWAKGRSCSTSAACWAARTRETRPETTRE